MDGSSGSTSVKVPVVVVGVDGSANSKAALRWAARYASRRAAQLHVVIAWGHLLPGFGFAAVSDEHLEREARATLEGAVAQLLKREPGITVVKRVVRGHPVPILCETASEVGAEILVVGDRGYGGFAGLLLGSVGERCVRDAPCTVVVVRGPELPAEAIPHG